MNHPSLQNMRIKAAAKLVGQDHLNLKLSDIARIVEAYAGNSLG